MVKRAGPVRPNWTLPRCRIAVSTSKRSATRRTPGKTTVSPEIQTTVEEPLGRKAKPVVGPAIGTLHHGPCRDGVAVTSTSPILVDDHGVRPVAPRRRPPA